MSVDAIALLPPESLSGVRSGLEGGWVEAEGRDGQRRAAFELRDGVLVNLGFPYRSPDGELYDVARAWAGSLPDAIWIFPDTFVPEVSTAAEARAGTDAVGRWIKGSVARGKRSLLEEMGLSAEDAAECQRAFGSGDPAKIQAAVRRLEALLGNREPAEVERAITEFLAKR
jgi:hypothetical protein